MISFTYNPGIFQNGVFVIDPRASETMYELFKRTIPVFFGGGPLDVRLIGFLSQKFWRAYLSGTDFKGWGNWCGAQTPCSPGRSTRLVRSSLLCFWWHCVSAYLPILMWSFCPVAESSSSSFHIFSEGNDSQVVVPLVWTWEEKSSGFSYAILYSLSMLTFFRSSTRYQEYRNDI